MSTEGTGGRVGRRGVLGLLGSAAVGAAAGAAAVDAGASTPGPVPGDGMSRAAPAARLRGGTISPWGRHQPGVSARPGAVAVWVALDLLPALHRDHDREALARMLRVLTGDVEALTQGRGAPGDPAPGLAAGGADLTVTVGLGPRLLEGGWGLPAPPGWGRVPPMRHDRLRPRWCGGDVLVGVAGRDATTVGHAVRRVVADVAPFASLRWRQQGSWNGLDADGRATTGRNWFGQVDGSANPRPGSAMFDATVWISRGPWTGGTTLVVRRIRMDLPTWDRLTRDEQERSVGRDLATGAPLTGGSELDDVDLRARRDGRLVVARDSHVRRAHPSVNHGARIFRKGANYEEHDPVTGTTEAGLLFTSVQADLTAQFVPIQRSLDESDALNEWTTAIGSAEAAVLPGFARGEWLGQALLEA